MDFPALRSGSVRLRPLARSDLEVLLGAGDDGYAPSAGGSSAQRRRRTERRIERSPRLVQGRLDLGVEVDGRLVGTVEVRQPPEGLPPGVFEIGIVVFAPADRGRGVGRAAVSLLTDYLFADAGTHRVQASTWVENAAMRRVLELLGWTCEGVMRGFMPAGERGRQDFALYGVTRAEWEPRPRPRIS